MYKHLNNILTHLLKNIFYDCYYYSSKENIKKYPVKLAFDIDITGEIDSTLKETIVVDIFYKVPYELSQYYNITIADTYKNSS